MRKAAVTSAVSILLFFVVYLVAVRTGLGQRFENKVWLGAGQTALQRPAQATAALDLIGTGTGAAAVVAVVLIGLVRRQCVLGLAGAALILVTVGGVEFLKNEFRRPNLVPGWAYSAGNSYPSGHTATAMAVMFALILVAPYRIRGVVAFCLAALATEIGALTIIARWHRPSDTIGADALVLCLASLTILALAATGRVRPVAPQEAAAVGEQPAHTRSSYGVIALGTAVALCGALLYAALTYYHRVKYAPGFEISHAALYAGCLLSLAGSGLATLALLWLLNRVELG